jgi:hypothetical protein
VKPASSVSDLLKIDDSCASESVLVFNALGTDASVLADKALLVYAAAIEWVNHAHSVSAPAGRFSSLAAALKMSVPDLWELVKTTPAAGEAPDVAAARQVRKDVLAMTALKTLLQLIVRDYRWAVTDFRRLRLTAGAGYMRVQVESLALMLLFPTHPDWALRWMNPHEDGKKFFNDTQPSVKSELKTRGLDFPYEHGSTVAQHARLASTARGMKFDGGSVEVFDQEFSAEHPEYFHIPLAHYFRMQKKIFDLLPVVFPGLEKDHAYTDRLAAYVVLEDKTWWVLQTKYKKELEEAYKTAQP